MSATKFDIFSGGLVGLFLHEDVTNKDLNSESYVEIPECAAFPETGIERNTIDVPNFSNAYNRKLVGRMSVPDIEISVNYMAGSVHDKLVKAAEDGKRIQLKVVYYIDSTKKSGIQIAYNGFLAKSTLTGGEDAVVGRSFTFSVDGAPVGQDVFTTPASGLRK
ncbi:hypothetical protein VQ207_000308 [Salmonella enterica]|uniref:hypothetical protein n=1 Tax=Salmonella enterica TaxID=28901 RepID=UPI0008A9927F|nr:hypothetical protein [Salmonella enterica]EAB0069287.1 hypothetical protein [Salmonella enterica subsp. enterica]EBH8830087.1 hypothetical protein [Salmonella enterica subsp. enterica serovar Anatum]EBH9235554.1 hypothetical protein [Salmonella enterica subsp. enterica serovar Manhattan]ECU7961809.1 hypothetical protein [Salmonella enterica subsp. enterica serovar Newport]EDD4939544.1 hypothetical protein [Salmonella enterica subsp. enterica serovar Typhimurium]EDU7817631.1 hypothetical pr